MGLKENLEIIKESIEKKKSSIGIDYNVTIVGVTKTMPALSVIDAVNSGITDIGENRVQEAEKKFADICGLKFTRHLIGHLQENKAVKAAEIFDWVQSVDSIGTAEKLNRKLALSGKKINILIEVNTSGDKSKFGIKPEEASEFTGKLSCYDNLIIKGLMTIGPLDKPMQETKKAFALLAGIKEKLSGEYKNIDFSVLSMGMSGDYLEAIENGSNMVRLGRILFGERFPVK